MAFQQGQEELERRVRAYVARRYVMLDRRPDAVVLVGPRYPPRFQSEGVLRGGGDTPEPALGCLLAFGWVAVYWVWNAFGEWRDRRRPVEQVVISVGPDGVVSETHAKVE